MSFTETSSILLPATMRLDWIAPQDDFFLETPDLVTVESIKQEVEDQIETLGFLRWARDWSFTYAAGIKLNDFEVSPHEIEDTRGANLYQLIITSESSISSAVGNVLQLAQWETSEVFNFFLEESTLFDFVQVEVISLT